MAGDVTPAIGRVPVERLRVGDRVRAVERGRIGTVVDTDCNGWTLVRYDCVSPFRDEFVDGYRHGVDCLLILNAR